MSVYSASVQAKQTRRLAQPVFHTSDWGTAVLNGGCGADLASIHRWGFAAAVGDVSGGKGDPGSWLISRPVLPSSPGLGSGRPAVVSWRRDGAASRRG